ncbi:MAG TPA: hypothetical protein VHD36_12010 [Pirellulales bacterium]|nr:hypothetical protein [Pirellulales bacterium]
MHSVSHPAGTLERAYLDQVRPAIQHPAYRVSCDRALSKFTFWRGGPTMLRQVNDEMIDQFGDALRVAGFNKFSVADYPQIVRRVLRKIDPTLCRPKRAGYPGKPFVVGEPGSLSHFANSYCTNRDLARASIDQIRYAVVALQKHLARDALLTDLNADTLGEFIGARIDAGIARRTVHRQRGALLCLWREAARRKMLPPIEEVRRVKVPKPIPRAWLVEEFQKLLDSVACEKGRFDLGNCLAKKSDVLRALVLTGFYTGLRPTDLVDLRSDEVLAGGVLVIRQKKTDEPIQIKLPDDCNEAISLTRPEGRELVFPLARKRAWYWVRKAILRAKLQGSVKWLRRTGATRCEQMQPGSAKAYLGHLTDGLALLHYVDRRQIKFTRPVPVLVVGPALDESDSGTGFAHSPRGKGVCA